MLLNIKLMFFNFSGDNYFLIYLLLFSPPTPLMP